MLIEGVGPKKAQDVMASLEKSANPYQVLREMTGRSGKGLKDLGLTLESLAGDGDLRPAHLVNQISEYYLPIFKAQYDDYPKRARDLDHLQTIAERYQGLESFLSDLALEPPDGSAAGVEAPDRDDERLVLSTIHSAKGLEWQCVFVIWIVDGRFPSVYAFGEDDELEEERRLFYVAVTRAKRYLYLTYPINVFDRGSGMVLSSPSRFLDPVSPALLDQLALMEEGGLQDWYSRDDH
jgi:DNA helicase-2/ATP-dependent DNA helicase PcrA